MKVTYVKLVRASKPGKIKAFVDITLDNEMTTKGWKVIEGAKGLFCAPPSKLNKKDGKYYNDIYFPQGDTAGSPGSKFREYLQAEVLKKYTEEMRETQQFDQTSTEDDLPF